MNELKLIKQQEILGKDFKVYGDVENPFFKAKDVASWIEIHNVSQMLQTIDEDEKGIYKVDTLGGKQEVLCLTENGLYEVLMLSRKPIAKAFKKEVKKVLHSLRVNGGYIAGQEQLSEDEIIANALVVAHKILAKREATIAEMQPKADYYDKFIDSTNLIEIGHLGKSTGIGEQKIFKRLVAEGFIKVRYSTDGVKYYDPCYGYEKYFKSISVPFLRGEKQLNREKLMLTSDGYAYFMKKIGA